MAPASSDLDRHSMKNEKQDSDEFCEVVVGYDDEQPSEEVLAHKREEARLVKKLDVFIAPVLLLLMLISYLDRGFVLMSRLRGYSTLIMGIGTLDSRRHRA